MSLQDNLIGDFLKLGCPDERQAYIASQVYLDLCEAKRLWNVNYHFNADLDIMYLTAKRSKSSGESVFIPISTMEDLSFTIMRKLLTLKADDNSIHLAIVSPDSTFVYYQLTDGLGDPPGTGLPFSEDRLKFHDAQLQKYKKEIKNAAEAGHSVTIGSNSQGIPKPSSHDTE